MALVVVVAVYALTGMWMSEHATYLIRLAVFQNVQNYAEPTIRWLGLHLRVLRTLLF